MKKYKYEDLQIGMQVTKTELDEIEYVWMLVKYQYQPEDYGINDYGELVYFEKENLSSQSLNIRNKITSYIANTKTDANGCYEEFWGVYLNGYLGKVLSFENLRNYVSQVQLTVVIPEGQPEITVDTSFGKWTKQPSNLKVNHKELKKYNLDDLEIGMQVTREELKDIEHVWMLVKYQSEPKYYGTQNNEAYDYGTLVFFEKENFSNHSLDIRNKIQSYIANTKTDKDGSYGEFWGIYLNGYLDKYLNGYFPYEEVRDRAYQIASAVIIPKGQFEITVDTSFGKYTCGPNLNEWDDR